MGAHRGQSDMMLLEPFPHAIDIVDAEIAGKNE
jgi:hypothetical protein